MLPNSDDSPAGCSGYAIVLVLPRNIDVAIGTVNRASVPVAPVDFNQGLLRLDLNVPLMIQTGNASVLGKLDPV